jgi:hypothetical protein
MGAPGHVVGVGHLGHGFRMNKAGQLDMLQAGRHQAVDEMIFLLSVDGFGFVLQAIAGTDFVDLQVFAHTGKYQVSKATCQVIVLHNAAICQHVLGKTIYFPSSRG